LSLLPSPDELPWLPRPWEILETKPCEPVRLKVVRYEFGKIVIRPRYVGAPPEKVVVACRIHTTPEYKPVWPHYWDITPQRLVGALYTLLRAGIPPGMVLVIHRDMPGPAAHWSVRWEPEASAR